VQSLSLKVVWLTVFSLGLLAIPPNSLAQDLSTKGSPTKDAVDRLTRKNLQAIRDAIEKYSLHRENLTSPRPLRTVA